MTGFFHRLASVVEFVLCYSHASLKVLGQVSFGEVCAQSLARARRVNTRQTLHASDYYVRGKVAWTIARGAN